LLVTETLTGAQLTTVLDQQWIGKKDFELLGVSRGFTYTWDASKPDGTSKLVPGSIKINGTPLDPAAAYRVTIDAFLADGGDGLTAFREGTEKTPSVVDLTALNNYLTARSPLAPPPLDRIVRLH
jgi:5'-nucleotidase